MKRSGHDKKQSREDKRITRMHQMEQMEAAARGTRPTFTLDTSGFDDPPLPQQQVDTAIPASSSSFDQNALVAQDFLSTSIAPAPSTGRHSPTSTGNFFSQREKYEVDQSINLMDASSKRYSATDYDVHPSTKRRTSSSFVDIFLGSNGAGKNGHRNGSTSSWKTSTVGRILILCMVMAFMFLLALSVPFLMTDTTEEDTSQSKVEATDAHAVPDVNHDDSPVEARDRFDSLKTALVEQQVTNAGRLQGSAYRALRWLTDDDEAHLDANDPDLSTRFAMATFYYATHPPPKHTSSTERQILDVSSKSRRWTREGHWMTSKSVCDWHGVLCEEGSASVIHLNLTANKLQGTIPMELKALSHLVLLDLSANELMGTIPPQLGQHLRQLKYFVLQRNQLSGTIPDAIHLMKDLYELYLSHNQLTGTVPESFGGGALQHLKALYLAHNRLTGTIPDFFGLPAINYLHMNDNKLHGSLPQTIGELSMLYDLRLGNNKLTGRIPPAMSGNVRLRLLSMGNNHFNGKIPDIFGDLRGLTDLQLHGNSFKSELPASMGYLTSLRRLTLEGNVMTGSLPTEWGKMTDLEALELYHNEIVGPIPTEFGGMTNLRDLGLGHNFLQGEIPTELGNLTRLKSLGLQHNAIRGTVPVELGYLTSLQKLDLYETLVTGEVPTEVCDLTDDHHLRVLEADCRTKMKCSCCSKCH